MTNEKSGCLVKREPAFLFTLRYNKRCYNMIRPHKVITLLFCLLICSQAFTQNDTILLNFEQLIDAARNKSPQSAMARHAFKSAYWQYRSFKAGYLPLLSLSTTPIGINRSLVSYTLPDGSDTFIARSGNNSLIQIGMSQKIPFTGGEISIGSELQRTDFFTDSKTSYMINPIKVAYRQPIFAFNPFKWERKIEPLRYQEAKKSYRTRLEEISQRAVQLFFDLVLAQINTEISQLNYQNNDTLYKIAQGRYNIGTIARDELLQMELAYLNSQNTFKQSLNDYENTHFRLRSYLGYPNTTYLQVVVPDSVPEIIIDKDRALEYARSNNPRIDAIEINSIEADREVARTRSEQFMQADLFISLGLSKTGMHPKELTHDLLDQQQVSVGLSIPILDWGKAKGHYKMALSNRDLTKLTAEQERIDFEQQISLQVSKFNIQKAQIATAAKADTISQLRYQIAKQRFMVGKVAITDLNIAGNERDGARRNYIGTIRDYWVSYFVIRYLTAYDFIKQQTIDVEYETE